MEDKTLAQIQAIADENDIDITGINLSEYFEGVKIEDSPAQGTDTGTTPSMPEKVLETKNATTTEPPATNTPPKITTGNNSTIDGGQNQDEYVPLSSKEYAASFDETAQDNDLAGVLNYCDIRIAADKYLNRANQGTWECPICGAGTHGHHNTGLMFYNGNNGLPMLKCQACQKNFNVMQLVCHCEHLQTTGEDFIKGLKIACEIFGVDFDNPQFDNAPTFTAKVEKPSDKVQFNRLSESRNNLKKFLDDQGGFYRGIPYTDYARANIGYLRDQWFKCDGRQHPALIFEMDNGNIFCRAVDGTSAKHYIGNVATSSLNIPETDLATAIIVIVEGIIDALSILHAMDWKVFVIANNGLNIKNLQSTLKRFNVKPNLILMLDNDEKSNGDNPGQNAAAKWIKELRAAGYAVVNHVLSDEKNLDCNAYLIRYGVDALKNRMEKILAAAQFELDEVRKEISARDTQADETPKTITKEDLQLIQDLIDKDVTDARELIGAMDKQDFSDETLYDEDIKTAAAVIRVFDEPAYLQFKGKLRNHKISVKEFENLIKPAADSFKEIQTSINRLKNKPADKKSYTLTLEQRKFLFNSAIGDLANARRIAYLFGDELRYIKDSSKWATYNGQYWSIENNSRDVGGIIYPYTARLADSLSENADTEREHKIAATFTSVDKVNAAIKYLKSVERIVITRKDLNTHKNLLCCQNGIVDLETKKLYPHNSKLLITQMVRATYRPNFYSDVVNNFLKSIMPDEEARAALMRILGYSITGEVNEEKSLFIHGGGRNGKGTLTQTLMRLLDSYSVAFPVEAVLAKYQTKDVNAATPAFTQLEHKRLAICDEIPAGQKLATAKFKQLTGGDPLPVRRLHEEASTIENPTQKMIFSGNFLPELDDVDDDGLLERLIVAEFTQTFTGANCDIHLKQKLLTADALSGLLSVLIDNAHDWYKEGLLDSTAMKKAKREYLREQDFILDFVDEYCKKNEDAEIRFIQFVERLRGESQTARNMTDKALRDAVSRKLKNIVGVHKVREGKGYVIKGLDWSVDDKNRKLFGGEFEVEEISDDRLPFD